MKDQFIPYELAVKLKELGFDDECAGYFSEGELFFRFITIDQLYAYNNIIDCIAPLWQQTFDWFREKHSLGIQQMRDGGLWVFNIVDFSNEQEQSPQHNLILVNGSEDYQLAQKACLDKLIDIISKRLK